jgi:hypothetical protein
VAVSCSILWAVVCRLLALFGQVDRSGCRWQSRAGIGDAVDRSAHLLQNGLVEQAHELDLLHQRSNLIAPRGVERLGQIPLRDSRNGVRQFAQWPRHAAPQHDQQAGGQQDDRQCHQAPHRDEDRALARHGLGIGDFRHHPEACALGLAQQGPGIAFAIAQHAAGVAHETVGGGRERLKERLRLRKSLKHLLARSAGVGQKHRLVQAAARIDHVGCAMLKEVGLRHLLLLHLFHHTDVIAKEEQGDGFLFGVQNRQVVAM